MDYNNISDTISEVFGTDPKLTSIVNGGTTLTVLKKYKQLIDTELEMKLNVIDYLGQLYTIDDYSEVTSEVAIPIIDNLQQLTFLDTNGVANTFESINNGLQLVISEIDNDNNIIKHYYDILSATSDGTFLKNVDALIEENNQVQYNIGSIISQQLYSYDCANITSTALGLIQDGEYTAANLMASLGITSDNLDGASRDYLNLVLSSVSEDPDVNVTQGFSLVKQLLTQGASVHPKQDKVGIEFDNEDFKYYSSVGVIFSGALDAITSISNAILSLISPITAAVFAGVSFVTNKIIDIVRDPASATLDQAAELNTLAIPVYHWAGSDNRNYRRRIISPNACCYEWTSDANTSGAVSSKRRFVEHYLVCNTNGVPYGFKGTKTPHLMYEVTSESDPQIMLFFDGVTVDDEFDPQSLNKMALYEANPNDPHWITHCNVSDFTDHEMRKMVCENMFEYYLRSIFPSMCVPESWLNQGIAKTYDGFACIDFFDLPQGNVQLLCQSIRGEWEYLFQNGDYLSWENIVNECQNWRDGGCHYPQASYDMYGFTPMLRIVDTSSVQLASSSDIERKSIPWLTPPHYKRAALIWSAILLATTTALIAGTTVFAKVKMSRKIQNWFNGKYADVQNKFQQLQSNPKNIVYQDEYLRSIKKYNRLAKLFGKSTLSVTSGWEDGGSVSNGAGSIASVKEALYSSNSGIDAMLQVFLTQIPVILTGEPLSY